MRLTNGLVAFSLAALVALAGISIHPAPVSAADPPPLPETASPVPSPTTSPAATPDPAAAPTPAAAATASRPAVAAKPSRGARVARVALAQRHKRYVRGAVGPRAFDCSGLVRYAYRRVHVARHLGGGHSARQMLHWGRAHHKTGRRHPHIGDVVIYGGGTHAAIYIGRGRVISALNPRLGIRVTRLHALGDRFTTFIHTRV